ncbi:MAG: protein-disulfide reductase DsbD [Gammaproteobacteria bacterium]|jgi:thiol:disulfide interchange protein DsbD|nr:protein-disulfide reductase DsbD [Gammaproteobacteria bacterium]
MKIRHLTVFLFLPLLWAASTEPLRPELAYQYKTEADAQEIRVQLDIEDGYYLYRKRFRFNAITPGLALGEPVYPAGDMHTDEFFGEQEIYRGQQIIRIPYTAPAQLRSAELGMRLQGCADMGLCYPPQDWTSTIALPASPTSAGSQISGGSQVKTTSATQADGNGKSISDWLAAPTGNGEPFLPPDQAFRSSVQTIDQQTLAVVWTIAPGYYLYKDKLSVAPVTGEIQLGFPELPAGEPMTDEYFGETEVYFEQVEIRLPFVRSNPEPLAIELELGFQGCAKDGICYPPSSRRQVLEIPDATRLPPSAVTGDQPMVSEQDRLASLIRDANLFLVLATFFGLGLLLAFTPCVLPMVPILSGIIVGQGEKVTTRRALSLSIAYVAGMALTYTVAGVAFAAMGQQAQTVFQQPWIIVLFSGLFVALALSMFGLYELQLPASLQTRLSMASNQRKSGSYLGTIVMGALSALIVSACVAPPLVAALAVIGQVGDVFRGGAALFALSLGMGAPLIVFGASAGKLLPKAGAWMEAVKSFFGFLLLGVALWMLDRVLPAWTLMLLWSALSLTFGAFLLSQARDSAGRVVLRAFAVGLALALLTWGVLMLVGLAGGNTDPLQPLKGLRQGPGQAGQQQEVHFQRIKTVQDLQREVSLASARGQAVMLDFYADWCVSCKEMEKYTFPDPAVKTHLDTMLLLQADVTANDEADRALLRHFEIFGPPTIAIFGTDGVERKNYRVVGYMPAAEFSKHLEAALAGR